MGLRWPIAVLVGAALAALGSGCGLKEDEPDLVAGKQAFVEKCGACHTLARAGTEGVTGPNLDEAFRRGLADGMERDGIRGAVRAQIDHPAEVPKDSRAYMPPDLVTGEVADDVAAYVARSVAAPGDDTGALAEAVEQPGGGEPAAARDGTLEIEATSGLAYVTDRAEAPAGRLRIRSPNPSGTPHDIALEGNGVSARGEVVSNGGVSGFEVDLEPGEYTFFCTVPGHREGGMEGTLTVK